MFLKTCLFTTKKDISTVQKKTFLQKKCSFIQKPFSKRICECAQSKNVIS
ncbi:hypothetical protein AB205_0218930 [Aquarana catesbeiana]|uniref:Uncharacterized protein n=1 Tax=Aquarana catesbeiana TaxID=8400 RepID=A0A2G9R408_AQUCT|nr:hypothetical protein AB205_0218930 [Aquarana catesbeiana]